MIMQQNRSYPYFFAPLALFCGCSICGIKSLFENPAKTPREGTRPTNSSKNPFAL
jgi:hypothetical protein